MTMLYDDDNNDDMMLYDDDDDDNGDDTQVLASPWVVMRMLGTQFGYYVPVMPIGCKQKPPSLNVWIFPDAFQLRSGQLRLG